MQSGGAPAVQPDLIDASGRRNAASDPRSTTYTGPAAAAGRNPFFGLDYYLDNFELTSTIVGKGSGRANNVGSLKFTVTEPANITLINNLYKAVKQLKKTNKTKVILFTPRGEKFDQKLAFKLSKLDQVIFICGRYEGVDERVAEKIADMEISIGDYDLMGGELPAMVCIETISRLVPGVIGKEQLLNERISKSGGFLEYAQYTRPEVFKVRKVNKVESWRVPEVLLSGDHKKIDEWKRAHGKVIGSLSEPKTPLSGVE